MLNEWVGGEGFEIFWEPMSVFRWLSVFFFWNSLKDFGVVNSLALYHIRSFVAQVSSTDNGGKSEQKA